MSKSGSQAPDLRGLQKDLALSVSRAEDSGRALLVLLRKLCAHFGWDFGESWVFSRDRSVLKPGPAWPRTNPAYHTFRTASRKLGFMKGGGLPGRVWDRRAPCGLDRIDKDAPAFFTRRGAAVRTGFHAGLALPLLAGEDLVSVLVLFRRADRPPPPEEQEEIASVLGPLGPIVARKQVEVELAARERQQKAVARLGLHALSEKTELETLMLEAARLAATTLRAEHCMLLESAGTRLRLRAGVGWPAHLAAHCTLPGGEGSQAGYTLQRGEAVIASDLTREERFKPFPLLREKGIVSALSVIVFLSPERHYGVLTVQGRQRRSFTKDDVHFLQAIANVLGAAIERKRVQRELARHREGLETLVAARTRELDASHERLRTAERLASIGTLAAGLGHDLGNTVLPMLCRLDSLEAGSLTVAAKEDLAAVRHAVDYLRQLSRGLRLFALDPKDAPDEPGRTVLKDWWLCVAPLLRHALPRRILLECDLAAGIPAAAVAPHRLSQAVLNLVSNAAEAVAGEGRIRVSAVKRQEADRVRLSIADTGRGMAPDVRRHSLDPFFTTKKRELSTGLGLALVQAVVHGCGGSIEIESAENRGTTFHLDLPIAPDLADAAACDAGAERAAVTLGDPRIAAYAVLLLRSFGMEADLYARGAPEDARIWITEPSAARIGAARQFLAGDPRRRVVFFGETPGGAREPRFVIVDRRGGPDAMRRSLRQVVFQILESRA